MQSRFFDSVSNQMPHALQHQKLKDASSEHPPRIQSAHAPAITVRRLDFCAAGAGNEDEVGELCRFLGLVTPRDTEKTAVRVFRFVIHQQCSISRGRNAAERESGGIKSSAVAEAESLNRLTAMHHLNRMVEAGILEKRGSKYFLRQPDLEEMVSEMEQEMEEAFSRARLIAERIRRDFHER